MSVIEYETQFNRKSRFALRFLSSEHDRIEHFVDVLRREIWEFVVNRDISSFSKVVEYARRREHDLTKIEEPTSESKRQQTERTFSVPTQRQSRSFTPRRSQSQNIPRAQSQVYSLQSNASRPCQRCGKTHQGRCLTETTNLKCFCCGEMGHVRVNCPKKNRACYSYGVFGHRQFECPRMRREESKASMQQPPVGGASSQKEEVPKAQARAFQITAEEARNEADVITGIFFVNSRPTCILFDSGATNFFVSHVYVRYLEYVPVMLSIPFTVDTGNGVTLIADRVFRDCTLVLDEHEFFVDLIPMDIHGFDVVIGMDWLVKNRADIICFERMIRVPIENGDYLYIYGERRIGDLKVISMLKARRYIAKGFSSFMAYFWMQPKK
ncbi:uncharacterized protein LOC112518303 [Cynara cardunculus var. scolymus]|uniref:uncharacterized protein LOC112518303 n=1 Tax=Cynara cardunculus var. scolymus TaxID=59895 RepID=UPI000D62FB70|nr:uncharacterized protein LOC112518303 [Cynara cardunculus var. scolymus]